MFIDDDTIDLIYAKAGVAGPVHFWWNDPANDLRWMKCISDMAEKVGENRYMGSCGCVFDAEGNRVEWCGDHCHC